MSTIITPDSVNKQAPPSTGNAEQVISHVEQLSKHEAERLLGAFARLHELEDTKIITPTSDAEKRGIQAFLSNSFLRIGPQLLGSYLTLKGEYEPLVLTFSLFFRRVLTNVNMMEARAQEQEQTRLEAVRAEAAKSGPPTPSPEAAALRVKVDDATAKAKVAYVGSQDEAKSC